jgi:acyl carrier protein
MANKNAVEAQIIAIIKRTFGVENPVITRDTVAADVPGWDSVAHSNLIMDIESELGIAFDLDEVFGFQSVGDLIDGAAKLAQPK